MKRALSLVGILAISFGLSGALSSPAHSADLSKFLPSGGGIVNIDERQAQLERRISDAVSAGRLTRGESQTFLDELDKIAELKANFKASSDNLSTWESLKLVFQLDTLSRRLEQSLRDRTLSGADLDFRIREIESRLADARSSKRLTEQEANEISYEINRIKLRLGAYASDNLINDVESLNLALALDAVSGRLESTMHDRQYQLPNIDKLQSELEKRISEGVASGKIDAKEATELKEDFKSIADREAKLKRFGRPMTSVETLELALDLEKLAQSIDKFSTTSSSTSPDYAKRKERIEARTARGLVSGKLTLAEAYQLKEQLTELETDEKRWTQTDGSLSPEEQKALTVELEKLAAALERRLVDISKTWPGISEKLDTLDRRITAARSKGRLSESDATALSKELSRISAKWNSYGHIDDDGVYPLSESLEVSTSIERLNQKLSDSLHDRTVEIPKLDVLNNSVDERIAFGITTGKLSLSDAKRFIDEFDGIITKQMGYQASGNDLQDRERLLVALEYQQLLAKVERAIHDNVQGLTTDEQKLQINEQIGEGVASGKLTESESTMLKSELARVRALEATYKGSGNKLSGKEALTVLQELKTLQAGVRREVQDTEIASSDLGKRMDELQLRIATGVTTGKLTVAEATNLRKDLSKIKDQEREYSDDGGISRGEATTLAYLLEKLGANIEAAMRDSQVSLPNIQRSQEEIDRKLANAVVDGTIGLEQVERFGKKLEDIGRLELSFRYSGDGLSFAESSTLKSELETLSKSIDDVIAKGERSTGLDEGIQKTASRINDGIQNKKLAPDAASALKAEIDRIQKAKLAFAHSQGGYDLQETESLVKDLDRLNAELDLRLRGQNFAWSDIDRRQQSVELQMRSAIKSGKLNPSEARRIQQELDRIKRAKAAFTVSDGDLNYFERVSLAEALDKLDDMMKKRTR
jgi:polyhydroxyalkanoate synthesis regulator phasin